MLADKILLFVTFIILYNVYTTSARDMTCFCSIHNGPHVNSRYLIDVPDPKVTGFFRGCKSGNRLCPGRCWNNANNLAKDKRKLSQICETRYPYTMAKGVDMIATVRVSNCGTRYTYKIAKKLCCYKVSIPIPGIPDQIYGYPC